MSMDETELSYRDTEEGGCMVTADRDDVQKINTYRDDRNGKQILFADAFTFLKNPKLKIDRVEFTVYDEAMGLEFIQLVQSLGYRLNVKSIEGRDLGYLRAVQELISPEQLEVILYDGIYDVPEFNEMAETHLEILKDPKLKMKYISFTDYNDELSAKFSKILKSLNSELHFCLINVSETQWIDPVFQSLKPEKVDEITIGRFSSLELTIDQFRAISRSKQWRTKTRLLGCHLPEQLGLEDFFDFKETRCHNFAFTENNLIKIRDVLLKSRHLEHFEMEEQFQEDGLRKKEMKERIERIMSEDPAYNSSTRRFSIPDSSDYFQLCFSIYDTYRGLTIYRTSPE